MRRFLFLLVLCWALAGMVVLSRTAERWVYIVPSEAGELLYIATFEGFLDEWQTSSGRLAAEALDGKMRVSVGEVNSLPYSPTRLYFSDFDMTVDATPVEGPMNNGYGVVFRLIDGRNNYRFHISSDGYYKVEKQVEDQAKIISNWALSPLIKQGLDVTNQLRVVARGDQFQFYINGERVQLCLPDDPDGESTPLDDGQCVQGQWVDMLTDATFAQGRLGVSAESLDESGVVVDFDNLVVYGPQETQ